MVGGSNFGELLGAAFVFLFTNLVTTPMPWLRLDALMLLIVWYLPYWTSPRNQVRQAWIVAATFIPVSFGWAAGDVSLAAYIQASLARKESERKDVSALGAVMAFLYSTYIVTHAITQPLLDKYIDRVFTSTGGLSNGGTVRPAIRNFAGALYGEALDKEVHDDDSSAGGSVEADSLKKERNYVNSVELAQPGGRNPVVGTLEPVDALSGS
ncbi:hypothetical protein GJ744_005414 [Endocarpon pusillum]|uniref:Uncharacterized protein n=1 Tax=Endocarpon pusillum TaxID=364733 RepID=A0A8H7A7Z4_9EURO|nr:hypothetical protein GJ744_005414 [Endocarpon pusillum]